MASKDDEMSAIERAARAIYETQDNPIPWDSETLGDWRRNYEREKAKAALDAVNYWGAVEALRKIDALLDADMRRGAFFVRLTEIVGDALMRYEHGQ